MTALYIIALFASFLTFHLGIILISHGATCAEKVGHRGKK